MAQTALPAPRQTVRRRVAFGMFDADGWPWSVVKALFWFVVIITMLGWIPDRAYYFTVGRTVELWPLAPFMKVPLVSMCPAENETLPCPAPAGATLPWQPAPAEVNLPKATTDAASAVIGTTYIVAGGSDGTAATADTWISHVVGSGNLDKWSAGPALPEPRSDAAFVTVGSTLFLLGGYDAAGAPTSTVFSLTVENGGAIGKWTPVDTLALPAPRAGAAAVTVSDGIVLLGGTDGTAATKSVWKTQADAKGKYNGWTEQSPLYEANVDGFAAHVGDVISLIGGTNDQGQVVATVQQGLVGGDADHPAPADDPNAIVALWRASAETNLPGPRTDMSGFASNGAIYVQGGSDGVSPRTETLWAQPNAEGVITSWMHLAQTDLGTGLAGSAAVVNGAYAFLFGGTTPDGVTAGIARTYLAPQAPYFQAGILGATVPGLQLQGEIGQQIGYLNAAGAGTVNFIILLLIGYAFNHKPQIRAWVERRRNRR
jgi:hypothetical protein